MGNGFLLQMSYRLEFVWANTLATIFIFLGKVFIVVLNCFTLLFFMKLRHDDEEVTSKGGPLLVCIVASYFTANLFLIMDEAVLLFSLASASIKVSTMENLSMDHQLSTMVLPRSHPVQRRKETSMRK